MISCRRILLTAALAVTGMFLGFQAHGATDPFDAPSGFRRWFDLDGGVGVGPLAAVACLEGHPWGNLAVEACGTQLVFANDTQGLAGLSAGPRFPLLYRHQAANRGYRGQPTLNWGPMLGFRDGSRHNDKVFPQLGAVSDIFEGDPLLFLEFKVVLELTYWWPNLTRTGATVQLEAGTSFLLSSGNARGYTVSERFVMPFSAALMAGLSF